MSIRKQNRAIVFMLWGKGVHKQEIASKLDLTLNYVEKLFAEFHYHSVVKNGTLLRHKKNNEWDFILCSNNDKVWNAYERMVNPKK